MRLFHFALLLSILALSSASAEEPSPRAIVERALKSVGITEVERPLALEATFHVSGLDDDLSDVRVRVTGWTGDHRVFAKLTATVKGKPYTYILLHLDGRWSMIMRNAEKQETQQAGPEEERIFSELIIGIRALWLIPLLKDKGVRLAYLGKAKQLNREVQMVEVVHAKGSRIQLAFDARSGRLTRMEQSLKSPGDPKGTTLLLDLENYKRINPYRSDAEALLKADAPPPYGREPIRFLEKLLSDIPSEKEQARLIQELGHTRYSRRKAAADAIGKQGRAALLWLSRHADHEDKEVARRIAGFFENGEKEELDRHLAAVLRVIGAGHLDGSAEVLLKAAPLLPEKRFRAVLVESLRHIAEQRNAKCPTLLRATQGPEPQRSLALMALKHSPEDVAGAARRRLPLPLTVAHKMILTEPSTEDFRVVMELEKLEIFTRLNEKEIERLSKELDK